MFRLGAELASGCGGGRVSAWAEVAILRRLGAVQRRRERVRFFESLSPDL